MKLKDKIKTREQILKIKESSEEVFAFTSGTFDILHSGHVKYLEKAKKFCDCLIVGLNSDSSVRSYKNEARPIISENSRAEVIAALACVDYVFIFSEINNKQNIESIKPDIYIKAGDYSEQQLSSAPLVRSYGGKVEIIPFESGFSSSSIIEKAALSYSIQHVCSGPLKGCDRRPAVFIDRDGTINKEVQYLHEPEKFEFIEGAQQALSLFSESDFLIVIITNQPGIGMGYFGKEDFYKVNLAMLKILGPAGIMVDKIYMCPHSQSEKCSCRKPEKYFIDKASQDLNIDLANSFVIGDMTSDIQLAKNAGCTSVLVSTGKGGSDKLFDVTPDLYAKDLLEAAKMITN